VLGDQPADSPDWLPSTFDATDDCADVVLGDPPLRPRSGDGFEVDAEFLRDLANDRGCARPTPATSWL
jgi:hypothetical protein